MKNIKKIMDMFKGLAEMKKEREKIINKWQAAGFLDGLTTIADEKIIEQYQCCTTSKINDMLDLTEIKKDLYKSKAMANFSHYVSGNLYYTVMIGDDKYQFSIATVEENHNDVYKSYLLSSDLGTTAFNAEIRGSELIRWIGKALERGELIKVG